MKQRIYNKWTQKELAVVRLEAAQGRLSLLWPSPALKRVLRRHSRECVRVMACKTRKTQEVAE